MRALGYVFLLLATPALAANGPSCKTFDRTPACCPHPPPTCCEPSMSVPVDDATIAQICGATAAKGQSNAFHECKHYFASGETVSEVDFGREVGDDRAFDKLKTSFAGGRARISDVSVAGASRAFVVRDLDERGQLERTSGWARVAGEIVHVDAERAACDDGQVLRLLAHAVELMTRHPS